MTTLINPRLFAALGAFYPDVCSVQVATEVQDASGFPVKTWADVVGLTAIRCRLSPAGGREVKSPNEIYAVATHVIELTGSYPTIAPKQRAMVAGQAFDILLVETDGSGASTRLVVQVVN